MESQASAARALVLGHAGAHGVSAITAAEPPVLYGAIIGLKSIPAVGVSGGGTTGGGSCFSPDTLVKTQGGAKPISEFKVGDVALTAAGTWKPIKEVLIHECSEPLHSMEQGRATATHPVLCAGHWVRAEDIFDDAVLYNGRLVATVQQASVSLQFDRCALQLEDNGKAC